MTAIAAMGVATERIEFHTFVLKMPMRHPVVLAKEATSVAVLTDNRLVLGVGTSPWPDDYEIVGLPWERRGRRFDECIDIVRGLSRRRLLRVPGRVLRVPRDQAQPRPDAPDPDPHRWSLRRQPAPRRVARATAGWRPADRPTTSRGGSSASTSCAASTGATRSRSTSTPPASTRSALDGIKRLEDLGVTHTSGGFGRFNPYGVEADPETLQEKIDNLRRYADDVIAKVRP